MHEERTQGIVLRSLDYKDSQRIITAFTPIGLISLIVKGLSKRNAQRLQLTGLFSEAEFVFRRGKSDLLSFLDGSLLDGHLRLRERLSSLQTAGHLAQIILSSQLDGKTSADLYQLFRFYLKQIPTFASPECLAASFQLKLLAYEGLLALLPACNRCKEKKAEFLSKGESLCNAHPLEEGFHFSSEEWALLLQLQQAKQFSALRTLPFPAYMHQKIDLFFKYRITNQ
jgi:DNA repair protein RecO (recombination protein O)